MNLERQDETDRIRVRIEGSLDSNSAIEAMRALDALVAEAPPRVELDLSGLQRIDSAGVGAIVTLFRKLRAFGGHLDLVGLSGQPRALFQLLRLDRVFGVE